MSWGRPRRREAQPAASSDVAPRPVAVDRFIAITEAHHRRLLQAAIAMCKDQDLAADLTQDALVRGYVSIASLRDNAPVYPWLITILRNVFRDHLRAAATRYELAQETFPDVVDDNPTALDQILSTERADTLRRAVSKLPSDSALAVTLVDIQGLSYEEAAVALDVPIGTIRSRLSRARDALRTCLLAEARRNTRSHSGGRGRTRAQTA